MNLSKASDFNDDIDYLFHSNIVEYDMNQASVSVSERFKLLDEKTIKFLKLLPKERRSKAVGCLQRDNDIFNKSLREHIVLARNNFLEANNIKEGDILSTHTDAVIFKSNNEIKEVVDGISFKKASESVSYLKYDKRIEIFFSGDCIDFKQIPKDLVKQQSIGMNTYILNILKKVDNYDDTVIYTMAKFQRDYLQDKLPEYFYQPFGKMGPYKFENLNFLAFLTNAVLREVKTW